MDGVLESTFEFGEEVVEVGLVGGVVDGRKEGGVAGFDADEGLGAAAVSSSAWFSIRSNRRSALCGVDVMI